MVECDAEIAAKYGIGRLEEDVVEVPSAKAFLINQSPDKLTKYERIGVMSHFGQDQPELIRIKITDAYSHLKYCEKNVNKELDVVFLPGVGLGFEGIAGTVLLAVESGFVHAFFGKNLELRRLTGVTVKSVRFPDLV